MVITLTGNNSFLLKSELDKLVQRFIADHGDFAVEKLDGEEVSYDRIMESVQSLPFLASKKLVILHNGQANKQLTENIEALISSITDSTDLVIVEPKLDKRLGYYKVLKKKTDFKEFLELDPHALATWLVKTASDKVGQLKQADARYLVERVGANQQLLSYELEKLLAYQPTITKDAIDALTEQSPQSTIFELLDAAFAGNIKRAINLYQGQRAAQVEPQQILAMIAWQLHILALVKTARERSSDEIAKETGVSPFVVRKSQTIASRLSLAELKKLLRDLLEIDVQLKSQPIDPDEALQNYLLRLSM